MRCDEWGGLLAVGLACAVGVPVAQADIYKWVGEDGSVVYSNSPPKNRNRIAEVFPGSDEVRGTAPVAPPQSSELQALAARVEQLTDELAAERRARAAVPPPPAAPPAWSSGCDWSDADCRWSGPTSYLPATVIVTTPFVHRFHRIPPRHFQGHTTIPRRVGGMPAFHPVQPAFRAGHRGFRTH